MKQIRKSTSKIICCLFMMFLVLASVGENTNAHESFTTALYEGFSLTTGMKEFDPTVLTVILYGTGDEIDTISAPDVDPLFEFSSSTELYFGFSTNADAPFSLFAENIKGLVIFKDTPFDTFTDDMLPDLNVMYDISAVSISNTDTVVFLTLNNTYFVLGNVVQQSDVTIGFQYRAIPEPSTLLLLGIGLIGVLGIAIKRRTRISKRGNSMNYGKILMLVMVSVPLLMGTAIAAELNVTKTGSGDGVVIGEDIWCGDECSWEYGEKTVVHLKAAPYPDSTFAGWLVNEKSCEGVITIEEDTLITAKFEQKVPPDEQIQTLYTYAQDTWKTFEALVDPSSGLPADNITADGVKSKYTSPTNIGAYIWSTIVARDLHIISPETARGLIAQTLTTLSTLEKHPESGQFYNWYDPETGEKLLIWPPSGDPIDPFLSSVDNGWLAVALIMVTNSVPQLKEQAQAIFGDMDFKFYYDPDAGLLRGGYWPDGTSQCNINGFTCHHYGTLNTEPRIASYIGIALHDIPPEHYFKMWRTFPDSCDWSWPEMQPGGETRTYLGVDVFEGHYTYRGMKIVPSWGGSMFEALMVPLFVPEEDWGPKSWGINHPLYVNAQIQHGLEEAMYGYWGFSPSNNPSGGYREYGVDAIGMNTDGYASNNDNTFVDYGFGDCPGREPKPLPTPDEYTNGVVTPHASFLALEFARDEVLNNLAKLRNNFDVYGDKGFYDAVNIATGEVAKYYLALDQGMVMAALGNALRHNHLQHYFTKGTIQEKIQPLLQMEEFTAGY